MYTVFNTNDSAEVHGHNMSATDAMKTILGYDGHGFGIEQDGEYWTLKVSTGSRNAMSGLGRFNTVTNVIADTLSEAEDLIADYVIKHSGCEWSQLEAVQTEDYFSDRIKDLRDAAESADDDGEKQYYLDLVALAVKDWESVVTEKL